MLVLNGVNVAKKGINLAIPFFFGLVNGNNGYLTWDSMAPKANDPYTTLTLVCYDIIYSRSVILKTVLYF